MFVENTTFILCNEVNAKWSQEYVIRYSKEEVDEVFTKDEQSKLAAGKRVVRKDKHGETSYVCMVIAAKKVK